METQGQGKCRSRRQQLPQRVGAKHGAKNKVKTLHEKQVPSLSHTDSWLHLHYPGRDWRFYSIEKVGQKVSSQEGPEEIRVECHNERRGVKRESEQEILEPLRHGL